MNDIELDEILDKWTAPPAPPAMRESVRAGFAVSVRPAKRRGLPRWILRFAGAMLGAAAILFLVALAFPQTADGPIPYVVESEYRSYGMDGSSSITMYTKSYNLEGAEHLISRQIPGDPLGETGRRALDVSMNVLTGRILPLLIDPAKRRQAAALRPLRGWAHVITACTQMAPRCLTTQGWGMGGGLAVLGNSCVWPGSSVLGRETILNYSTVTSQFSPTQGRRITTWMAPDLGCFALRAREETLREDRAFHLVSGKQAVQVTSPPALAR